MARKPAKKPAEKATYLMLRIPPSPKIGSVATIEMIATSANEVKQKMRSEREPQAGADYCLVKVEEQVKYRTTFTAQSARIDFTGSGEAEDQ